MTQGAISLRQVFDSPQQQQVLMASLPELAELHSKMHEYSEPVKTCLYILGKLHLECDHYHVAMVSIAYLTLAENSSRVVGASPYVEEQLRQSFYVNTHFLDECRQLTHEIMHVLNGAKHIMPQTSCWDAMRDDTCYILSTTEKWLTRVIRGGEMDAMHSSEADIQNMACSLRNAVERVREAKHDDLERAFSRSCTFLCGGYYEKTVEYLRNKVIEGFADNYFVKSYLGLEPQQRSSWTALVFLTRNNMQPRYDDDVDGFIDFLAQWSYLESREIAPWQEDQDETRTRRIIEHVARSAWYVSLPISRRGGGSDLPTRNQAMAILGCILFERRLLPAYGQGFFSIDGWCLKLQELGLEGIGSRSMRMMLSSYASQLGSRHFEDIQTDHFDLWQSLCDLLEDVD